jgi:ABC-2 type transport system ATP-binding protein
MDSIVLDSVTKVFRHRPALFNWIGKERAGETRALDSVSLRAAPGEVLLLLGPNGSGKTTALKLLATILLPDAGRVLVNGADTGRQPAQVRSQVGFAVANERSFFPRLSARENLDFFAALNDVPRKVRQGRVEEELCNTGLLDAADTLVMKFSSGMYQRLGIARALLKGPTVLLLDEPTRSLDPSSTIRLWELVRKLSSGSVTVVIAGHNFTEAVAVGDSVAVVARGRITGHTAIRGTTVAELRSFYFHATGEADAAGHLSQRSEHEFLACG